MCDTECANGDGGREWHLVEPAADDHRCVPRGALPTTSRKEARKERALAFRVEHDPANGCKGIENHILPRMVFVVQAWHEHTVIWVCQRGPEGGTEEVGESDDPLVVPPCLDDLRRPHGRGHPLHLFGVSDWEAAIDRTVQAGVFSPVPRPHREAAHGDPSLNRLPRPKDVGPGEVVDGARGQYIYWCS